MAVVWVGVGFFAANPLALAMTLVIGVVYGTGALELLKFRRATATLTHALTDIPDNLSDLGFADGPPQGETRPLGGQRSNEATCVGAWMTGWANWILRCKTPYVCGSKASA